MKRAAWYLVAGAVAGFAGVIGLHSRGAPAAQSAAAGTGGGTESTQASPPGPSAGPSQASRTGQPSQAAAGGAAQTATGATEHFGYGEIAVSVTVSGSRITNVTVPILQTVDPTSQQLSGQAIPRLRSQVLAADGAHIDGVSGATFTSQAYETSVQAALDKLHLK
jgi:uncharacterized protein with FMN-binding domain